VIFGESSRAADMIGMFVGEKQRGDILRLAVDMLQAFFKDARAEADIDQNACLAAFDINGVALTAAGEYRKLKNSSPLSRSTSAGNFLPPPFKGGAGVIDITLPRYPVSSFLTKNQSCSIWAFCSVPL
jgi:hypothetical protein